MPFPSELTIDMNLEGDSAYVLADGFSGTVPAIYGVPNGWKARVKGGRLVLQRQRGFILMVR